MQNLRSLFAALAVASTLGLAACGGGGGGGSPAPVPAPAPAAIPPASDAGSAPAGPTEANVVAIIVDGGTNGQAFNSPFVTVTVCVPGTAACQQVDHVLLDTGSFGLRVLASALDASVALPQVNAPSGGRLAECAPFASGYAWGSVHTADLRIGGESAGALPVQVVNDASIPAAPQSCTTDSRGNARTDFGVGGSAKGILGIGVSTRDCGTGCAATPTPGIYYACDASTCSQSTAPLSSQVANPVPFFATDNNGAVVTLPAVPPAGAATVNGTLTFGIATRANNQLGTATVYATDTHGLLWTTYKGSVLSSFFDTGSNALFFNDASLAKCPANGFYCPPTPLTLPATITSVTGVATNVSFTVSGLQSLAGNATAAPIAGDSADLGGAFDWGLPFFFGRTVFLAFTGAVTPAGPGPYLAF